MGWHTVMWCVLASHCAHSCLLLLLHQQPLHTAPTGPLSGSAHSLACAGVCKCRQASALQISVHCRQLAVLAMPLQEVRAH
eukprot:2589487-Rhodomonas_salina.2